MFLWTKAEIEHILMQLDEKDLILPKYSFVKENDHLKTLGQGGSAYVFEAKSKKRQESYAIKVIGFGEKDGDSDLFFDTMDAHMYRLSFQDNVMRVHNFEEVFVWVDENDKVLTAENSYTQQEGNCLKLQLVVMEKLSPVFSSGKIRIDKLIEYEEGEVLKLAYDIGMAVSVAHQKKIIHRDIKLENVFFSEKENNYKLGDFGIAKVTDEGLANTVTFTKGYGAPEVVGSMNETYDGTADIYSLGIMLYILMNEICFPDSDSYSVNAKVQYRKGYKLPKPANGSTELFQIVEKMCAYNPDDRYQSMKEVLDELESLIVNSRLYYKRKHKKAPLVIGSVAFLAGIFLWKWLDINAYGWLSVVLVSFGIILTYESWLLGARHYFWMRLYYKRNLFWISVGLFYCFLIQIDIALHSNVILFFRQFLDESQINTLISLQLAKAGGIGLLICAFLIIRETILIKIKEEKVL